MNRALLLVTLCLSSIAAAKGISINEWFYEIDGDGDSQIAAADSNNEARDVRDGGVTTSGRLQGSCKEWAHTSDRPYMGARAYTVQCDYLPDTTIRSEQHFLQGWTAGEDNQRSLSFAFRLTGVDATPVRSGGAWMAQLHGEGLPFNLKWVAHHEANLNEGIPAPGYYLYAGAQYHVRLQNGTYEPRTPYQLLGRFTPGTWMRFLIQVNLTRNGPRSRCPNTIRKDASYTIALMDNATGQWGEPFRYPNASGQRMGNEVYAEDVPEKSVKAGDCLHAEDQAYNFKLGQYVVLTTNRADYDNITYGKRWINITKNHLTGYKKSVLRLAFDAQPGPTFPRRAEDTSYTWNGGSAGDPISDYDNDGMIAGGVEPTGGVNGRALHFPGTMGSFVKVPIGPTVVDDFDVGNYMTVSAWFRTTATPVENKGLVMIDEFSDTWKLLLYMRGNGIAFGVRHRVDPGRPGIYSRLDHEFPMGQYAGTTGWHLVTGTYNRFAPGCPGMTATTRSFAVPHKCERIKLYIDGKKVMGGEGADLPILHGERQLVVGKYSVNGFFEGDIDDVGLFNYTMTDADVQTLWQKRGAN